MFEVHIFASGNVNDIRSVVVFILSSKVHLLLCSKHNIHYRDNIVYRNKMSFCYRNYRDIGFFIIAQP